MDEAYCAHCRKLELPPEFAKVSGLRYDDDGEGVERERYSFDAQFPGICLDCDKPIKVGQKISKIKGDKGYAHTRCR
jgi:hypothetical protein